MMKFKKFAISCLGVSCFALALVACNKTSEHSHVLEEHIATDSTCVTQGNDAYWECTDCGKYFADADGAVEIDKDSWLKELSAHTSVPHAAHDSTCVTHGNSAYWECSVCHKYFSDEGMTAEIKSDSWLKPLVSHTLTPHPAVDNGCETAGNSAYWECTVCEKYFSDGEGKTETEKDSWVLPAAHKWDKGVVTKDPTQDEEGERTFTCTECGETEIRAIPKLVANTTTHGAFTESHGEFVSAAADSLLVINNYKMTNGSLHVTLTKPAERSDNGVIFGLADGYAADMWEPASSYYFFFISQAGTAYLAKVDNGQWKVLAEQGMVNHYVDYGSFDIRVIRNGANIKCYVDDILYITYDDATPLTGDNVGIRAQKSGIKFKDFYADADVTPVQTDNLIVGSSVMRFWTSYESDLSGIDGDVLDIGISGSQTSHWKSMTDEVIAYAPKRILFYAGGNDLTGSVTPQQVAENYRNIFDAYKAALPDVELVIITIHQSTTRSGENITAINDAARAYAAANPDWVKIADIENTFCDGQGTPRRALFTDGLHLKPAGYRLLANVVREALDLPALEAPMFMLTEGTLTEENGVITSGESGNAFALYIGENNVIPAGTVTAEIKAGAMNPNAAYGRKNGIVFASDYNNEAAYWNASTVRYYFYYIDAVSGELCFVKFSGGLLDTVQSGLPAEQKIRIEDFDDTKTYELKAVWDGATVKCYLDGELKITFEDDDPYTGKYAGLRINSPGTVVTGFTAERMSHAITVPETLTGGSIAADKTTAASGETVTLTVNLDDGYRLETLTVNGEPVEVTDGVAVFTMPERGVTVAAEIVRVYAITVADAENGTVTVDKQTAKAGEKVTVTIAAATDYRLKSLAYRVADGTPVTLSLSGGASAVFDMPEGDVTVTAEFEAIPEDAPAHGITVTALENGEGEITVAQTAREGEIVTVTVTTNAGWVFESLTVNGTPITVTAGTATFEMPQEDVTIVATYARTYNVNINDPANGTLTLLDSIGAAAKAGADVTVVARPNSGYKLASLTVTYADGTVAAEYTAAGGEIVFAMPAADVTVAATFEAISKYTVRNGSFELVDGSPTSDGTQIRSTSGAAIAILTGKSADRISITMSDHLSGDSGIVFGLTDNGKPAYWENDGEQYYSYFITYDNGHARLATIDPKWSQLSGMETSSDTDVGNDDSYLMEAVIDRANNVIHMFVDGKKALTYSGTLFAGTAFGVRAGVSGVRYEYHDVADKLYVMINDGTDTTLSFVESGAVLTKPQDPVKQGYIFEGWYSGGAEFTAWGQAVTSDVSIEAKFRVDESANYAIRQGGIDDSGTNYKTTAEKTLIVLNNKEFTGGTIEATIKPNTANDCALIFGVAGDGKWETDTGIDYRLVMINNGGNLFLATLPWKVVSEKPISNFDVNKTYKIKLVYNLGIADVYLDDVLMLENIVLGGLPGTGVGFRAANAGTEFGKTVTIEPAENNGISVKSGAFTLSDGKLTSAGDSQNLAVLDGLSLGETGMFSVKINLNGNKGDNGLVIGLDANCPGAFFEGGNLYYFPFIDGGSAVRLGKLIPGWNEPACSLKISASGIDTSADHIWTVVKQGSRISIFIDGVCYLDCTDASAYSGTAVGLRAGVKGVTYSDWQVSDTVSPELLKQLELKFTNESSAATVSTDGTITTVSRNNNFSAVYVGGNTAVTDGKALTVSADFKIGTGRTDTVAWGSKNGIIFGLTYNSGDTVWGGKKYYFCYIDAEAGKLVMLKFNGGTLHLEQDAWEKDKNHSVHVKVIENFGKDKGYNLKIEWDGATAKCYINGELLITYTDDEPLSGTYVGLRSNSSETVISNFTANVADKAVEPAEPTDE